MLKVWVHEEDHHLAQDIQNGNIIIGVVLLDEAHGILGVGRYIVYFEIAISERVEGDLNDSVALFPEVVGIPLIGLVGLPDVLKDKKS